LKADLAGYIYEEDRQGRVKIVDPPRSPDCGDALIMAHWRQKMGAGGEISIEVGHGTVTSTLPKVY